MKKLIIITAILGSLIAANILINNDNSQSKKDTPTLSEAIALEVPASSFEIIKSDNKINLMKKEFCYEIKSIAYCADDEKVQFLKKFLSNKVKDIYENNTENLSRLGFNNTEKSSSIIINDQKTLLFGNINKYNEVYVLQANRIYKVDYYKGILETTTKHWVDKSKPLLPYVETDEFDVRITKWTPSGYPPEHCKTVSHKDFSLDTKYSILRNTFFDLHPSDIERNNSAKNLKSLQSESNDVIHIAVTITNHHNRKIEDLFYIWKEKHLVYAKDRPVSNNKDIILNSVIPNSVFDNINIFCKK